MTGQRTLFFIGSLVLSSAAIAQSTIIDSAAGLQVGSLAAISGTQYSTGLTGGYAFKLPSLNSAFVIKMPLGTSWLGYSHVDLSIRNNGTQPARLELDTATGNGTGW